MTPTEAVLLTRYVKACCPQQKIDEYTPDAWHDLLGDLDAEDCRAAAAAVARRQPFVAPAEIREEVSRLRSERLAAEAEPAPPAALAEKEGEYRAALATIRRRIGDGRMPFRAIEGGRREGTEPSAKYRENRSTDDRLRVLAQTVPCPVEWCPARAGEPCRSGPLTAPMTRWHPTRLAAARKAAAS